ncbi:MAG: TlpA disulfide reductase family protein [bacterium]
METIQIGPMVLDAGRFFPFLAFAALVFGARLSERRFGPEMGPWAWRTGIWALVGARVSYVLLHLGAYLQEPLSVFYLWQGGFSAAGALAAAAAVTLYSFRDARRKMAAAGTLLAGASLLLAVLHALPLGPGLEGRTLPDIRLEAVGRGTEGKKGTEVGLSRWQGQPLVVNLWATWCPPCRREMPLLEEYAGRSGEVVFLMVDQGEGGEEVEAYLEDQGLSFPWVLLDPDGQLAREFQVSGLPTTLVFDARRRLVEARMGEVSRAWLEEQIARVSGGE